MDGWVKKGKYEYNVQQLYVGLDVFSVTSFTYWSSYKENQSVQLAYAEKICFSSTLTKYTRS